MVENNSVNHDMQEKSTQSSLGFSAARDLRDHWYPPHFTGEEEKSGPEKLSELPRFTQLVRSRVKNNSSLGSLPIALTNGNGYHLLVISHVLAKISIISFYGHIYSNTYA